MNETNFIRTQLRRSSFTLYLLLILTPFQSVSQTAGKDVRFKKYHLWDEFYSEVSTWGDINKDGKERPVWVRHLIDDNSGVGIQFVTEDMNKDGKPDIVISNKNGVFYFQQE